MNPRMIFMDDWQIARDNNQNERLDWKIYLNGKSLNHFVAEMVAEKRGQSTIESEVKRIASLNGLLINDRALKLIHIGVGARMAEMRIEKTALKARLSENCQWRAKVRSFSNGTKYIFINQDVNLNDGDMVELKAIKLEA
jgi:hypothetical protein